MIPDEVLDIVHKLDSQENKNLAVQWYTYVVNTRDYISPEKFKELEEECGVNDFPKDPFKYEVLGHHIDAYLNYFFYTGDRQLHSPIRVVRKAKSWAEENLKHDYNAMIVEIRSIEYLYNQIISLDWSHTSDLMRRKVFAWVNVEMKKKFKNDYKNFLQNQLLAYQNMNKKLKKVSVIDDEQLALLGHNLI